MISIIIFCYKKDFFLTKVCVASIHYFYPKVKIYLVKDKLCGDFSLKEITKSFEIEEMKLGKENYGWGTAKMFVLFSRKVPLQKYLLLDSDTVFIGRVLDKFEKFKKADFIVSPEYHNKPKEKNFERVYYSINKLKKIFKNFQYPGFTFNSGSLVVTPGKIKEKDCLPFFNSKKFPFWNHEYKTFLPCPEQSFLNIFFATPEGRNFNLGKTDFMWWSESKEVKTISLKNVQQGKFPRIIHWAGSQKTRNFEHMTHPEILRFFEKYYYKHLCFGKIRYFFYQAEVFFEAKVHNLFFILKT